MFRLRNSDQHELAPTASEVVRQGLRILAQRETLRELRREELRKQVQAGLDQLERDLDEIKERPGKA